MEIGVVLQSCTIQGAPLQKDTFTEVLLIQNENGCTREKRNPSIQYKGYSNGKRGVLQSLTIYGVPLERELASNST